LSPNRIRVPAALAALGLLTAVPVASASDGHAGTRHVLLISVDGLHQADLTAYAARHPRSALAGLLARGTAYTGARTPVPSDSFPGLIGQLTRRRVIMCQRRAKAWLTAVPRLGSAAHPGVMRAVRGSGAVPRRLRLVKPIVFRSGRVPDRLEAWVIVLLGLLAAGSIAVVGVLSAADYGRLAASAAADAHARHLVVANLRPDIPAPAGRAPGSGAGAPGLTSVTAAWNAPDGQPRRGVVEVGSGAVVPKHVQVWTDQAGRQVAPPLSGSEVFITAVLGGVLWESAALAVLGGVYLIGRHLLDKHRARLWERALARWRGDATAP